MLDSTNGAAIAGARVHVRASPDTQVVLTGADGRFVLPVTDIAATSFQVSAALAYDPAAAINYETAVVAASPGSEVQIPLRRLAQQQNLSYQPVTVPGNCGTCHAEQYQQWLSSNHAHAARNALVRDLYSGDGTGSPDGPSGQGYVFLDMHAAPASGLCATCHAPNERPSDPGGVKFNEVLTDAGREGVTCTSCHQLHDINDNVKAIHLLGNAEFRFPAATGAGGASVTHQYVWGPLDDIGFPQMRALYAPVFSSSRMCASCHEYENPVTGAPGQETYTEWLASPAASAGVQCQDCHMPSATTPGRIANVGQAPIRPGSQRHDHSFPGVYSGRLGNPVALSFSAAQNAGHLVVDVAVENLGLGHHYPTGVDVRNAFVLVEARLDGQPLPLAEGDTLPFWVDDEVPGQQEGDYAGMAGRGFAKLLEGRIDGQGPVLSPVPFIDADALTAKTTIPPGEVDRGTYAFGLPPLSGGTHRVEVRARVFYRRAWRAIAVAKNWIENEDGEPWERVVADRRLDFAVEGPDPNLVLRDGFERMPSVRVIRPADVLD
ncbi:MAG: hypothetical protein MEQ07_11925 [Aquimonas sp.]|nr:hypothetical protein [Aquimonas sp.]